MKFSPIYAALLTSLAGISTAHAAQVTQDIADGYGASGISPHLKCLYTNPNGSSKFCLANIKPKGLSLEPNQTKPLRSLRRFLFLRQNGIQSKHRPKSLYVALMVTILPALV